MKARLPLWKGYLYSLSERIRIYRLINSNQWRFGFSRADVLLLRRSITKYLTKGGQRKPRAHIYDELVNRINAAMGTATKSELELVMRLNVVKLINVEDLPMELKGVKKLAAEVGITDKDMVGLTDLQIAKAICDTIDPEKTYSAEFIAWYEAVPDGAFDQMDGVTGGDAAAVIDAEAIDGLIKHIASLTKAQEFKDLLADEGVKPIFAKLDCSKFKLAPQFKKGLTEYLEILKANPPEESAIESPEISKEDLAKAIDACTSVDELIAIIESNQGPFEGLDINDTELVPVKAALIGHLGVDLTPPKPSNKLADLLKKKTAANAAAAPAAPVSDLVIPFDPTSFDPNPVYEEAGKLQIGQLRKFYKQVIELSPVEIASEPGMKKDIMLDAIATALVAISENGPKVAAAPAPAAPAAECKMEVNSALIKAAVEAEDKESLIAMCDALGIKLNALQKRSIPQMEKMLNEKAPAPATPAGGKLGKLKLAGKTTPPAAEPANASYLTTAFMTVESMVLAKAEESAIVDAVMPIYASAGKTNKLVIKARVKQLMEIVAVEHGLKAKK